MYGVLAQEREQQPMDVIQQVRATIARHHLLLPGDTVVLGISGGPDSLCLLHILRQLADEFRVALHVGHLHHGLRDQEADEDARFVAETSRAWGVPCTIEQADVPALARARGLAIEEAARQARYAFLAALARRLGGQTVAVAHHADDQVETVLMHFLRGSGLAGLRGMRPLAWLDEMRLGEALDLQDDRLRLVRPLLEVSRAEIEAYCAAQGLQPRFDRSNLDRTYFRNRLRHELIPLLETYQPNLRQIVVRTAEVLAADYELLREQLARAWPQVVCSESAQSIELDLAAFRALPLGLQRSILREGIHRLRRSLRNINWVHVEHALEVLRRGQVGAKATLPQGLLLTISYTKAILAHAQRPPSPGPGPHVTQELPIPVPGEVSLPGGRWLLRTRLIPPAALPPDWRHNPDRLRAFLDADKIAAPLCLRPRREGDWLRPLGLGGRRQKLRDFLINRKIPQAERATLPLLVCGQEIVWVVGWDVDEHYAIGEATERVLVVEVEPVQERDVET
jgi:tRNA(Ile)-lysidine synthetase-like protein